MSGHSKWATTKHKKAVVDARRGKLFAKLIKNIEVAARVGGGDPAGNPTLYDAIQKAKKNSVPNDNIDRAVKRGSGAEGGGANYETLMYEAYGPAGIALLIECLTDNRNRSASDVRVAVTRNGGTMADAGSTARMFTRKGVVIVAKQQDGRSITEDDLLEATLDADPEEINDLSDNFEIITDPSNTVPVRTAVQQAGLDYESAEVSFVPEYTQEVDAPTAEKLMRIIDALEDSDDIRDGRQFRAPADSGGVAATLVGERTACRGRQRQGCHIGCRTSVRLFSVKGDRVGDPVTRHLGERMRVLGIDPGLTRCGLGVVDGVPGRQPLMVAFDVVGTPAELDIARRLLAIEEIIEAWVSRYRPTAVAIERVFAQHNVQTVMGTAQAAGVAMLVSARHGIPVSLHTPSEVKASITGSGRAPKEQVGAMVTKILKLEDPPKPPDAADALALAICHVWRGSTTTRLNAAVEAAAEQAKRQRGSFRRSREPCRGEA
jgi:crossover junction endodeoxyribonuclease RuvC